MQKDTSGQWCAQIGPNKVALFSSEHLVPQNVCSRHCFWGSQQHDQGLTLLQRQLLAAAEKTGQFGISIQPKPAMLPMTLQNIQLLGTTVEAGGHQKK